MWIISQFLKIIFTGKYPVFFLGGGGFEEGGGVNLGTVTIYTMFPIIFYVLVFNLLLGFIVCFIFKFFCLFLYFCLYVLFLFLFRFVLFLFLFCVFFWGGGGGGGSPEAPLSSNQYLQLLSMAHLNNEPEFYKLIIGWYLLYFFCFEGGNQFGYTLKYRFFLYMYFLYPYLWF